MNSILVVKGVESWVVGVIPALISSFSVPPEELDKTLPLVIAAIRSDSLNEEDASLPGTAQFEQTLLRLWTIDVVIMVKPDPVTAQTEALYGYVDALGGSLRGGVSLSDKVVLSHLYDASYDPPEVEYDDGTIARQVTISVVVGETVGA